MRSLRMVVVSMLLASSTGAVHAALISSSQNLDFSAGKQSLWGPDGVAASFQKSGQVGTSTLGFKYSLKASTGTVERAKFNGILNYSYDNYVNVNATDTLSMQFVGDTNGGLIDTLFGLSATAKYRILGGEGCIVCEGTSLDIDKVFTPRIDTQVTGSDRDTALTGEVGPDIGVASTKAGVDIDLTQTSKFTGTGITGKLTATNSVTGTSKMLDVGLTTAGLFDFDLGLDEVGLWDIALSSLTLTNQFFSSFKATLTPFAQYVIGFGCGDLSTDSDNGYLCGGDGRADWDLANLSLGTTKTFGLTFGQLNLNSFRIETFAGAAAVPEPGTLTLFGAGLAALGILRRRPRTRRHGG